MVSGSREDDGHTALHWASYYGHSKVVKYLLKSGAEVDVRTRKGMTPLHSASRRGHSLVIHFLVEAGADTMRMISLPNTQIQVQIHSYTK